MAVGEGMKLLSGAMASGAAALLWVVLAWNNPSSTYHFAPLIVSVAWPWLSRTTSEPTTARAAWISVAGAATLALGAGGILLVADRLQGPTFWSEARQPGHVALEITIATVLGAALGFISQTQRERSTPSAS